MWYVITEAGSYGPFYTIGAANVFCHRKIFVDMQKNVILDYKIIHVAAPSLLTFELLEKARGRHV